MSNRFFFLFFLRNLLARKHLEEKDNGGTLRYSKWIPYASKTNWIFSVHWKKQFDQKEEEKKSIDNLEKKCWILFDGRYGEIFLNDMIVTGNY